MPRVPDTAAKASPANFLPRLTFPLEFILIKNGRIWLSAHIFFRVCEDKACSMKSRLLSMAVCREGVKNK